MASGEWWRGLSVTLDGSVTCLLASLSRRPEARICTISYAYAYALSDMRRITLVLMHILIQPPSSYKSSFSYKTSDGAETHDPSTHATLRAAVARVRFRVVDSERPR